MVIIFAAFPPGDCCKYVCFLSEFLCSEIGKRWLSPRHCYIFSLQPHCYAAEMPCLRYCKSKYLSSYRHAQPCLILVGCSRLLCLTAVIQYNISLMFDNFAAVQWQEDWELCEPISCAVHHISVLPLSVCLQQERPGCDIQPAGWQFAAVWAGLTTGVT